jgi:transposase
MFEDFNRDQVALPLDLEIKIQKDDNSHEVQNHVEDIPHEAFSSFLRTTCCPAYHPRMVMKIILCARTIQFSVLRIMWLAKGYEPSYLTINRFRLP